VLLGPQLRAFRDAGYEVIGASAPGPYVDGLAADGIDHVALHHATRAPAPGQDLRLGRELASTFRRLRPAIVHTHNPKPGILGRLAARAVRVPHVVNTVHGLYAVPSDPWPKRAVVYGAERLAAACSDAELVQNPEDVETLARIGVPTRKLHLLGNGVDLVRFDPDRADPDGVRRLREEWHVGPDDVVCGLVGRLVWEKGYQQVFEAARRLRSQVPNLRFVVVGPADPDKPDAVSGAAMAAARRDGVQFLGFRSDTEALYPAMDLYALASHREGFPRSAMEAAAMGLPIVATDIRGCRQVVEHGVTGLLVPLGDAGALADAVARLAADGQERRRMGRAARAKAKAEFDQQRVIDTTLAVYARLRAS
jgi:glycosyltransferase involved in cell wall biosynthesis